MPEAAKLAYLGPVPWVALGAVIGVIGFGVHGIGSLILMLLVLGFFAIILSGFLNDFSLDILIACSRRSDSTLVLESEADHRACSGLQGIVREVLVEESHGLFL